MQKAPILVLFGLFCNGLCGVVPGSPVSVTAPVSTSSVAAAAASVTAPSVAETTFAAATEDHTVIVDESAANSTDQEQPVDFDLVNLPGYGVIDDLNSTANASQFSCYHRRYGYYADTIKQCLMFHLCYPVQEPTTQQILFQRFSFVCSDNAVFDQQHLVCVDNDTLSVPCEAAPNFYGPSNDKLIASLHSNAQSQYMFASPKSSDNGEDSAAESAAEEASETAVAPETVAVVDQQQQQQQSESAVVQQRSSQTAPQLEVSEEEAQQYGALLESLFG